MFLRRHWIPPGGLLVAQACHGASWLVLLAIALAGDIRGVSGPALAWVHLVALGWLTMAAFSVLLHAIPTFTDLPWRNEGLARGSLAVFAIGAVAFAVALAAQSPLVAVAACVAAAGVAGYLTAAIRTLTQRNEVERVERAIARALLMTLAVLGIVAALGVALAFWLSGAAIGEWIARLPAAHANLGIFGWLSVLVYGVSARTVRPITGVRTRLQRMHALVGGTTLLGALALALGFALLAPWAVWLGAAFVAIGAIGYALDLGDILRRATVEHRPPQAFAGAAIVWLLVSLALGAGSLTNPALTTAFGFCVLAGWLGSMVNAHVFHIGTRVIATAYRGDDDETPPEALLDTKLEWTAFAAFQTALALAVCGAVTVLPQLVAAGAVLGFAGWAVMTANLALARRRAISG